MLRAMKTAPQDGTTILILHRDRMSIFAVLWDEDCWINAGDFDHVDDWVAEAIGWFECPNDVASLLSTKRGEWKP